MKLEEAKEIIKSIDTLDDYESQEAIETVIGELFAMQNLLDEKNDEIEHLQKENVMLENTKMNCPHLNTSGVSCSGKFCDIEDYISKDKIRKKIKQMNTEEKIKLKKLGGTDRYLTQLEYMHKENVLKELLDEE